MSGASRTLCVCIGLVLGGLSRDARADDAENRALFDSAVAALERGAPTEAVDHLELLADRGVVSADASFNRALAYVARAESPRQKPGDLGRAAAALAETVALGRGDEEAERLLEQVREEIARRSARQGSAPIAMTAGLGWAVVDLLSENVWAAGAAVGSALLSAGLVLALWVRRQTTRVASALFIGIGAALVVAMSTLTFAARYRRLEYRPAIVVVPEARLLDLAGRGPSPEAIGHVAVPEGAEVQVLERRGHRASIEWDGSVGWVPSEALLSLPRR
jgi:hypothetical protein